MNNVVMLERPAPGDAVPPVAVPVWLERLSASGKVLARHRFDTLPVHLGRDYSNDLLVDDPQVAAQHLLVLRDDSGQLVAVGRHGQAVQVEGLADSLQHVLLRPQLVLRLGQARYRVRQSGDAPDPPEPAAFQPGQLVLAGGLLAAGAALAGWAQQAANLAPASGWQHHLDGWPTWALVLAWATGWAGLGRAIAGRWHLPRHLAMAAVAWLAWTTWDQLLPFGLYSASQAWSAAQVAAGQGLILGLAAAWHWRWVAATPALRPAWQWAGWALAAAGVLANGGLALSRQAADPRGLPQAGVAPPPAWSARQPVGLAQALSAIDALRPEAEAAAQEPATEQMP